MAYFVCIVELYPLVRLQRALIYIQEEINDDSMAVRLDLCKPLQTG